MNLKRCRTRRVAEFAVGGVLSLLIAGGASALTYSSGDLVGVFVNSGTELVVDLGALSSLTTGHAATFGTPANFGATGALGGTFTAFEANAPFTGTAGRQVTFTTDPTVNPLIFDNQLSAYVTKIPPSQAALDDGSSTGWLRNLNGFPAAGTGGVIINNATELAIPTSVPSSYTNVIGLGTNKINNLLPFSTASTLSGNGQTLDLWTGTRTGVQTSSTVQIGMLKVDGNSAGDGSQVRITFSAVPEPGTLLLVAAGLAGLVGIGKRRREP